ANKWMETYNITTAGDIMCNLTSQAMCLEYLGITPPCSNCSDKCNVYTQLEDYLECIRVDKEFEHKKYSETRGKLTLLFENGSLENKLLQSNDKNYLISFLSSYLENGCSIS